MTDFNTSIPVDEGGTTSQIPAMLGPDGSKIPGAILARNGLPVSVTNPLDVLAEATWDTDQFTSLVGAVEAGTAAIEALNPTDIDPTNALVDDTLLTTLTGAPYSADIDNLADLADATNTHVESHAERLDDLEATVDTGTTGLVDKVAALEAAVTTLQGLVSDHATDIAALEAYNVSNP
jgi:hypothetical protein